MRGSAWVLLVAAALIWLAVVGWPAVAVLWALLVVETSAASGVLKSYPWSYLWTTVCWAGGVAAGAILIGVPIGALLGRVAMSKVWILAAALCSVPLCLPPYLMFYAWEQTWPPSSAISMWAASNGVTATLRAVTLAVALVLWSWPIVAWFVAVSTILRGGVVDDLLQLDGPSRWRAWWIRRRQDWPAAVVGALVVFLFVFNNTTSFDIAQVRTLGYELRALDDLGAPRRELFLLGLPGMAVAILTTLTLWRGALSRTHHVSEVSNVEKSARCTRVALVLGAGLLAGIPMMLLLHSPPELTAIGRVRDAYGQAILSDLLNSAVTGAIALLILFGQTTAWLDRRRWVRSMATIMAFGWLISALVPATIASTSLTAAYNRTTLSLDELVYLESGIVVLGRLARFGFLAVLASRWIVMTEAHERTMLREIDGAGTARGLWQALRPLWIRLGAAVTVIMTALAFSEVHTVVRLAPPGYDPIARAVLNALHYQREEFISVISLLLLSVGLLSAAVLATVIALQRAWTLRAVRGGTTLIVLSAVVLIPSCSDRPTRPRSDLDRLEFTFGQGGRIDGRFDYPRAMDIDTERGEIYIIDRTARVQCFDLNGEFHRAWYMPEFDEGFPTGMTVHPDGRVFVADTHEHRVMVFDSEGRELMQFGRLGHGPGEFIFPTDIAFGPDDRLYVSEYGENDRIQVFDAKGEFLFAFGSFGDGDGQFNRPQSMTFTRDRSELIVADAVNHRLVVFSPEGEFLRTIGSAGTKPGEFRYPYGVTLLEDDTLLVAEFGNNRVQRLSIAGESLDTWGGPGNGLAQMYSPWTTAQAGNRIFILDSRNNRVQVIEGF